MLNAPRGKTLPAAVAALALLVPTLAHAGGVYFVKKGDSLYRISRSFGLTVDQLKAANRLTSDALKPGMRLALPDMAGDSRNTPAAPRPMDQAAAGPQSLAGALQQRVQFLTAPQGSSPLEPASSAATVSLGGAHGATLDTSPPSCEEEVVTHVVRKGDTLSAIARSYGVPLKDLLALNSISSSTRLRIGQPITVKSSGPREYTVRRGDSLWSITRRYDLSLEDLKTLNGLSGNALKPGQRLLLEACRVAAGEEGGGRETALTRYLDDSFADMMLMASGTMVSEDILGNDADPPGIVKRMIDFAKDLLNIPYRFGGTSLRGIDCSAYVQRVFAFLSIPLPRTAREQFKVGEVVDRDELEVGDLVFFKTYARYASHVGIYLGENRFIHASSRARKVAIDSIDHPYYTKRFLGARRMIDRTGDAVVRLATNGL